MEVCKRVNVRRKVEEETVRGGTAALCDTQKEG